MIAEIRTTAGVAKLSAARPKTASKC